MQYRIYNLAKGLAKKLQIKFGAVKIDLLLTSKGPIILEMTTRLSGGFDCQYLVPAATGKNIIRTALLIYLCKKFNKNLLLDRKKRVAYSASLWPKPGIIKSISNLTKANKIKNCHHIFLLKKVGDRINDYIDCAQRPCFIIVSGNNEIQAKKTMNKVLNTLNIKTV